MSLEGKIVGGRYRLDRLIGEGGMAHVWAGVHLTLHRPVAVKLLDVTRGRDSQEMGEQFLREARIAAAVRHRNVIDVLDFGTTEEGTPYMVMEVLEGETLGARLDRSPALSVSELVQLVSLALRGLTAVHDAGIVHRDLKPENIFLQHEGDGVYPKLIDFGISRNLNPLSGPPSALTTKEGLVVGTPHYMSPEQVRGLRDIDKRTDIYSMGVVLYEALTGNLPFDADAIGELIIKIAQGNAQPVIELRPAVGPAISAVVSQAMEWNRDARFSDARDMQQSLLRAAEDTFGAGSRPISVMPRPERFSGPAAAAGPNGQAPRIHLAPADRPAGAESNGSAVALVDPLRPQAPGAQDASSAAGASALRREAQALTKPVDSAEMLIECERETLPASEDDRRPQTRASPSVSTKTHSPTPQSWSIKPHTTSFQKPRRWSLAAAVGALFLVGAGLTAAGVPLPTWGGAGTAAISGPDAPSSSATANARTGQRALAARGQGEGHREGQRETKGLRGEADEQHPEPLAPAAQPSRMTLAAGGGIGSPGGAVSALKSARPSGGPVEVGSEAGPTAGDNAETKADPNEQGHREALRLARKRRLRRAARAKARARTRQPAQAGSPSAQPAKASPEGIKRVFRDLDY